MKTRSIGILTLFTAFTAAFWGILFFFGEVTAPPVYTLAARIAAIESHYGLFILNYANAGLLTLACVAMLAGFYVYCQDEDPLWAMVALAFVPIYGLSNTVVYLSQVFVVPRLLELYRNPETAAMAEILLRLVIHAWSGSAMEFVNALAYAVLGIPSVILGILMYRKAQGLRVGSMLLAASGVLAVIALVGIGVGSTALALLSPVGGFVYLVGLILLGACFLRQHASEAHISMTSPPLVDMSYDRHHAVSEINSR